MLKSLYISNYALITELTIRFDEGFTAITGETGAGKSIIIGALSLILGQRAETRLIKEGAEKCIVEAEFLPENNNLSDFFQTNELDFDSKHCIVRRELTAAGKSRAFVNDTPVSLTVLRDLSLALIDIHSQHENLLLSNESYQLNIVDIFADNSRLLDEYQRIFYTWRELNEKLHKLKKNAEEQSKEADYIRFQFEQLDKAQLRENEQEELEEEQNLLSHAEEIKSELQKSLVLIGNEQMSLSLLREAYNAIKKTEKYSPEVKTLTERLHSTYIELKDIFDEIGNFEENIAFNPERLAQVNERLNLIYNLEQKYKVSNIGELICLKNDFSDSLLRIDSFDEEIALLEEKIANVKNKLQTSADVLTQSRKKSFQPIEAYLIDQLIKLGMPNIRFKIEMQELEQFTEKGNDEISFLFSASKNRSMQAIAQIASGGEISRLMLSIKALTAKKAGLPSIIFDEIDTGVSGEIAHRMGEIMQEMGKNMQVITITHLAQIAAKGNNHFRVYKDESKEAAETRIVQLTEQERLQEIAGMLSGKNISEASLNTARELLGTASPHPSSYEKK